uniref:Uncharacterized protein n=1 Tax=Arundo donax TaxID=35708 RepID=A0A0A9FFL0_ARUDO
METSSISAMDSSRSPIS